MKRLAGVSLVFLLAVLLVGCSGGSSDRSDEQLALRTELEAKMVGDDERGLFTATERRCYSSRLIQREDLARGFLAGEDDIGDVDLDDAAYIVDAMRDCLRDGMIRGWDEGEYGEFLTADQAECLVDSSLRMMDEAVLSGDLDSVGDEAATGGADGVLWMCAPELLDEFDRQLGLAVDDARSMLERRLREGEGEVSEREVECVLAAFDDLVADADSSEYDNAQLWEAVLECAEAS